MISEPQQAEREAMSHRIVIQHFSNDPRETVHVVTEVGLLDNRVDFGVDRQLDVLTEQWTDSPDHKSGVTIHLYGCPGTDVKEMTLIRPRVRYDSIEGVVEAIKTAINIPSDVVVEHVHTDWQWLMTPRISEREYRAHLFGSV